MKTLKTTIAILITLVTFNTFSQNQGKIWASIKDGKDVPSLNQKKELNSENLVFNQKIKEHNIISVEKVFPSSRNPELQKVYEITCYCNEVDLYTDFTNVVKSVSGVEYAPTYETLQTPNDYGIITNGTWALDLINTQVAWDYTQGDTSIVLGISDQNFYVNHEELINKVTYYDNTNTATRTHGTAVATIAGGNTNNNLGLSSVGYNSSLSLRRMNYNEMLILSYEGVRVINASWTSGCNFNTYAQTAIDEIYNNGSFIVASAGNGTTCGNPNALVYPASYNHVFSVSSVGSNDSHTSQNGSTHQHNSSVDIMAPGYNVPITAAPGWYLTSNGTSFASPYVTGTVGLMLSLKPDLTVDEIDSILRVSATNIDAINPLYVGKMGSGRLNTGVAIRMVYNMTLEVEDGNNGHGNDEDGVDDSNPGNGGGNNGNQGGGSHGNHGNHNGWGKKNVSTSNGNLTIVDMNGKITDLDSSLPGMYFLIDSGVIVKRIYKN